MFRSIKQFFLVDGFYDYPTPSRLRPWWYYGVLVMVSVIFQITSGIVLALKFLAHGDYTFFIIMDIVVNTDLGWYVQKFHVNGATFLFFCLYVHLIRGMYCGLFVNPKYALWFYGYVGFLIFMVASFTGYVLPWSQMGFWAVMVILSIFDNIPVIGLFVNEWVLSGIVEKGIVLMRFFDIHYLVALFGLVIIFLHIFELHDHCSSVYMGLDHDMDRVGFMTSYVVKDLIVLFIYLLFLFLIVCYFPSLVVHSDHYEKVKPLITPDQIVPEWYFLPYYAVLRGMPNKVVGVLLFIWLVFWSLLWPLSNANGQFSDYGNGSSRALMLGAFYLLMSLGILGGMSAIFPVIWLAQAGSLLLFLLTLQLYVMSIRLNHFS